MGLESVYLVRQISSKPLHRTQTEPVDVRLRVRGVRHVPSPGADNERVGVARLARGREVPLRGEAGASDGVDDEVVLAEDEGRVELAEIRDDLLDSDPRRRGLPRFERDGRERVVLALGQAGDVEELGHGAGRPAPCEMARVGC